jgi:hypothetical protein
MVPVWPLVHSLHEISKKKKSVQYFFTYVHIFMAKEYLYSANHDLPKGDAEAVQV